MKRCLLIGAALLAAILPGHLIEAQQPATLRVQAATPIDDDTLLTARRARAQPAQRMRVVEAQNLTVRNGDDSVEALRDIVVRSFDEQQQFSARLGRAELVSAGALVALPEVNDEVLVYDDAYVVRRSTTIIVRDPAAVARESTLYRDYLDTQQGQQLIAAPMELDAGERAGLQAFLSSGVRDLHPDDPLRAAAARGEQALLDAIVAGQGQLTVEDTLIIPRVAGVDQGANLAIPTIRGGVFDLARPEPVRTPPLRAIAVQPEPSGGRTPGAVRPLMRAAPAEPPARAPLEPKAEASGQHSMTAEFLLGATRAANFQWERKWTFPSGFFRLTLGAGYAFGYRVPLLASASVEPTRGVIVDYEDKRVVIGAAASVRTINGDADYYRRAGLPASLVMGGDELLLEANVGWGYKFRALWKDIAHRPYSAVGISFSQGFTPPMTTGDGSNDFALLLQPAATGISVEGTFVGGSAAIRLDGAAWGNAGVELQTLVDGRQQRAFKVTADKATQAGVYPYRITMDPVPLRAGTTSQSRSFGVRLAEPEYRGRLLIVPSIQLGFKVGYKKLKRGFTTGWIPLNSLKIDTGNYSWPVHQGTRSEVAWDDGVKTYRKLEKPGDTKDFAIKPATSTPRRATDRSR